MARGGRELWATRVARWRESGLTGKEFAAEMGINARSLAYWAWKLKSTGQAVATIEGQPMKPGPVEWVEVMRPQRSAEVETPSDGVRTKGACFELLLGSGRVVRVPADFDAAALRRLLAVVEAR